MSHLDHGEPQAGDLLRVWEAGLCADPVRRALLLLRVAQPHVPATALESAPIGERDRGLLRLREELFGRQLHTVSHCPECNERLEASFLTTDLDDTAAIDLAGSQPARRHVCEQGYEVEFYLPSSADLVRLLDAEHGERTAIRLLQSCVVGARRGEVDVEAASLPEYVMVRVAAEMELADPAACILIGLDCLCCGHSWQVSFDIATHLWGDLNDWAHRLLDEIHVLGSTYGWSEHDILAMSATRRQLYLQRARA